MEEIMSRRKQRKVQNLFLATSRKEQISALKSLGVTVNAKANKKVVGEKAVVTMMDIQESRRLANRRKRARKASR
jgi:hypothetical protein